MPWRDTDYRNWRKRVYRPAAAEVGIDKPQPYDLRHSLVSLLIHEGISVLEVARQAGHSPTVCLSTYYAHVFEESDPSERTSAEEAIRAARDRSTVHPHDELSAPSMRTSARLMSERGADRNRSRRRPGTLIAALAVAAGIALVPAAPAMAHVHGITPLNCVGVADDGANRTDDTPATATGEGSGPISGLIPRDVGKAPLDIGDGGFNTPACPQTLP